MIRPDAIMRHALAGAWRVPLAWGWSLATGKIAAPLDAGHVYRADGSRVGFRSPDGTYTVNPAKIKALSPDGRAWFKATLRNVAASDRRIKERSTVLTIAQLNPVIARREKALRQWATGGRKAAGESVPYNPPGATACCPDYGRDAWRYETVRDGDAAWVESRVIACGCLTREPIGHECAASRKVAA